MIDRWRLALLAALLLPVIAHAAPAPREFSETSDTLIFAPSDQDTTPAEGPEAGADSHDMPLAPFGERLITAPEAWREYGESAKHGPLVDYNRVDRIRLGWSFEFQRAATLLPRVGARLEYAFQRGRGLYGIQIEQPLVTPDRFAIGVSAVRRTDHNELQQVSNLENSLALLFARQDYRDYFEREGFGIYGVAHVPHVTAVSLHLRNDRYRTLALDPGTRSFFLRDRALRDNPAISDGEAHTLSLRLEQRARSQQRLRAGFYHWVDLERAGHGLGGDFRYTRLLADLRSVLRLSPATTLALRAVAGHGIDGTLPPQRGFVAGGVDGLRAHPFATYRGDQLLLGQAEYTIGLWTLRSPYFESGLHAIAFVDAGRAWQGAAHSWDLGRQHIAADGGFGLGTAEDNLRMYAARDLHDSGSGFVWSVRLQRPF